ncbi:putative C6 transcription factor [Aspergillus fischeri NRRL 181]|uniref:C6 transcription factor n=1 Tax=Neosartorya fischeri (strain ATCC 1020 / DSM 3700 / CBS 544.65 / FGSC A1164 / JCM 1740 / NRRL 181 / WB 181) TaxID=331117 RepID=A1CVN4_NEOFI|nr:conserved hypothetical protein [Aspergillus fischeri NRRL 181]EAW24686.1 conserved hypothetical protein [Aspergillus fischeri NRRL 181]
MIHAVFSRSTPSPSLPWLRYNFYKATSLSDNATRFKAELLHPIEEFQALVTNEYTLLFKDAFPHRVNEAAGLPEPQRARAREGVTRLLRKLDTLNGNITTWAYQNAMVDLRQVDTRENILMQGEAIWARRFRSIKEDIDALLEQFSYHGHPLQYVGSLSHGIRGRHKGKSAINMDDFDVDLFVAHAEWRAHLPLIREQFPENFSNGKIHPLGTHMHELQNLSYAVGHALAANLTGRRPAETATSHLEEETTLSPGTISSSDEYAANPRFLQLQEELRDVLFTAVASHAPTRHQSPRPSDPIEDSASGLLRNSLDFAQVSIPKVRLIHYLKNWIIECAPHLDKFDEQSHFGVHIPVLAQSSPALFYAILAFSARQTERKACLDKSYDSLELYQQSIRLLSPYLQAKDPNVLVTVCILGCLELMSVSPRDWRRHVEGCAALFDAYNVNGFSGGHLQAVFWCYARMELCGAIISEGTEGTILPLHKWVPPQAADSEEERDIMIKNLFCQDGCSNPDRHANWAVYLCAKTCNLACRRSRFLELGELDQNDTRPFSEQWRQLWEELQFWNDHRCPAMLPIRTTITGGDQIFPEILFAHWAAISGNQLYHTACIMMLQMKPANISLVSPSPHSSPVWHARRVCGISLTNPHSGNLINAIQPLYIAGKLLSHRSEHLEVARLFKKIETSTGWGALWRLRDLERAWGYETGEILSAI